MCVVTTVASSSCSRSFLGRSGSGYITSYNYPFDYQNNLACTYTVYLGSPPMTSGSADSIGQRPPTLPPSGSSSSVQTVCLEFRRFSLENSSPFCSFDFVELGGGTGVLSAAAAETAVQPISRTKYCGNGLWQYGVEEPDNSQSNVWSTNMCCKFVQSTVLCWSFILFIGAFNSSFTLLCHAKSQDSRMFQPCSVTSPFLDIQPFRSLAIYR